MNSLTTALSPFDTFAARWAVRRAPAEIGSVQSNEKTTGNVQSDTFAMDMGSSPY
jgi:hypothetical protein